MNRYLEWLADVAEWIKPSICIEACRDPDDNRFLEVLVAGDGDVLISGDADLLALHPFEGRPIVAPGVFLAEL
ncbi:MAG: putative toxin-antitoxin system toxin component, PIN family [Wenzhouxiangella sp.]